MDTLHKVFSMHKLNLLIQTNQDVFYLVKTDRVSKSALCWIKVDLMYTSPAQYWITLVSSCIKGRTESELAA